MKLPTLAVPSLLFFGFIGFIVDYYNFMVVQSEIFVANSLLGADELQLGILGTISALAYGLSALGTGLLSERTGRKPLALFAISGMGVVFLLYPYISTMAHLYWATVMRSVFTGFLWAPIMAWIADIQPGRNLSNFLSWYNLSWAAGILVGFASAGVLFEEFGWEVPFHVAAISAGVTLLFLLFVRPRPQEVRGPSPGEQLETGPVDLSLRASRFWIVQGLVCLVLGGFACSLILYVIPKFDNGQVSEGMQSRLNSVRVAGQMLAFYLFGRTAVWHFRMWPAIVTGLCTAVGLALVALGRSEAMYCIGFAGAGFGFGAGFMLCSYYSLALSTTKGKGSGTMELLIGTGSLMGPLFGGTFARLLTPRQSVASAILVCLVLVALALRPMGSDSPETTVRES